MDQATLTEFYSAKKRPLEGFHPAKRRKVVQEEPVEISLHGNRKIAPRRMKTRASAAKSIEISVKKTRKTAAENAQSSALDDFLDKVTKGSSSEPEKLEIVVTSVKDDHESLAISFKEESSSRRRKAVTKQEETGKSNKKKIEETVEDKERNAQKARPKRMSKKEAVSSHKTKLDFKTKEQDAIESNPKPKEETNNESKKQSIMVREKSPVKTSTSSGLKINPWIAEQANHVLLSRGQAALLLSQQKKSKTKDISNVKSKQPKSKETANTLSKTKAQEGLEKARELIKKMRSLESDAAKSKADTTGDKGSERLHKLAKRQSSETNCTSR